ncbi:MAG TPA: hypothetical protein VF791_07690 [Pyrinomonadaceae bacterium]
MIPLKRFPLLAAICLAFSANAFAQKFCTVSPPSPYKHNAVIVTTFDQNTGRMKATLEHPRPLSKGLYLYASFLYQDRRLRTPPTIDIYFIHAAKDKEVEYAHAHNVSIMADGNAWPFAGTPRYYTERGDRKMTLEKTVLTLSYANLVNLLQAKRVTARVGGTEFELSFNHLESLREIASMMMPPARSLVKR